MRNTILQSIDLEDLATVTGGCKKQAAPKPQPQPQVVCRPCCGGGGGGGELSVQVATGTQGGQLIQQAMQGGGQQPPLA